MDKLKPEFPNDAEENHNPPPLCEDGGQVESAGTIKDESEASYQANLAATSDLTDKFPKGRGPLDAIRRKCLDCVAGETWIIAKCEVRDCALWPYRMGKNVFHASAKGSKRPR